MKTKTIYSLKTYSTDGNIKAYQVLIDDEVQGTYIQNDITDYIDKDFKSIVYNTNSKIFIDLMMIFLSDRSNNTYLKTNDISILSKISIIGIQTVFF
jgi:hypothetical protein